MVNHPAKAFDCIGENLLMEDLPAVTAKESGVREKAPIPVTNDVDDNLDIFNFKYMTAISTRQESELVQRIKRRSDAPRCTDCSARDWDDPLQPLSVHVLYCFEQRPSAVGGNKKKGERVEIPLALKGKTPVWQRAADSRIDWQGEPMMGRLPYDRFGRLLLRAVQDLPDMNANIRILECNPGCACSQQGPCRNAFTRRGLDAQVEVFRTNNGKGWGVLTRQRILRGRFLSEYIGELLLSKEADTRATNTTEQDAATCLTAAGTRSWWWSTRTSSLT